MYDLHGCSVGINVYWLSLVADLKIMCPMNHYIVVVLCFIQP